jgi:hypothetical protein
MGGAGAGGAGVGLADPTASSSATNPPWALKLDPISRDFVMDEDGRYVSVHPIDHQAMFRLIPARETIRSAAAQGGPWKSLEIADEATMTRRLTEEVRSLWRDLIDAKALEVVRVSSKPAPKTSGRARIRIEWKNLLDPQDPNRTTEI